MGPQSHSPCARTRTRAHTGTDKHQTKCTQARSGLTGAPTENLSSVEQSSRRTVLLSNQHCDFPEKSKTRLWRTAQPANRQTVEAASHQTVQPSNRQTVGPSNRQPVELSNRQTVTPSNRENVELPTRRTAHQQTPAFYVVPEAPSALEFWQARATTKKQILFGFGMFWVSEAQHNCC